MSDVFTVDHLPARTVTHENRTYLFFSGTAYLGVAQNLAFRELLQQSMAQYGTVFGSSRNGNLRLGIYEQAEQALANQVGGTDGPLKALTLSSGMLAGQAVVNWLRGQQYTFLYAPGVHPAVWHDPAVTLPAMSFADWVDQLPHQLQQTTDGPIAILTNSLEAVRSAYLTFDWTQELPKNRNITLVVDDSHGLGVLNDGRGIWPQLPRLPNVRVIVTASLAKAMGLPGGVVFGTADTITDLRRSAFFGACSPMPPAYLDAFLQADSPYREGRERLRTNVKLAERLLLPTGLFQHADGYPVFFTEQSALYEYLLEKNILIYSFAYPTAADRSNTRIVMSAFHEPADIERLAQCVSQYKQALPSYEQSTL